MIDETALPEERSYGSLLHFIILAITIFSGGTLGFFVALCTYFYYKNKSFFLRRVAADALNIQLSGLIYAIVLFTAGFICGIMSLSGSNTAIWLTVLFIFLFGALALYFLLIHIVCALKCRKGEAYNPPLTLRIFR